jgi:hypothetical protein
MKKCNHGFHETLTESLTRVRNGKPVDVCPECGRNHSEEHFLEACEGLGIEPEEVFAEVYRKKA